MQEPVTPEQQPTKRTPFEYRFKAKRHYLSIAATCTERDDSETLDNVSLWRRRAPVQGGLSSWQQKKLADFIEANLAEDVSLAQMAGLVGLSPYHFARAFKQSFGVPPHRYHVRRRMARAKALLAERSVTEVALAVGFAETSSFSTAFRKTTGLAPSEYRRGLF
jgi:AraC-like DNA-binding protein